MNTAVRRSPTALASSSASVEESTPPEMASRTLPFPTCFCTSATSSSTMCSAFQSRVTPQMSRKLASSCPPLGVWTTSG